MSKDYNVHELDARQKKAISLLVARDVNGMTYEEIAEEVGVSSQTLYKWRHKKTFRDELNRQADEIVETYVTDVYRNLGNILSNPKAHDRDKIKAGEVILKLQGKYKEKVEVDTAPNMKDLLDRLDRL